VKAEVEHVEEEEELIDLSVYDLIQAFRGVLRYFSDGLSHTVVGEGASVDDKIGYIEDQLAQNGSVAWVDLFKSCRTRVELVCCFLAILELCRMGKIRAHQQHTFGDIRVFPAGTESTDDVAPAQA
jgi:segregation and condensation protein A